VAGEEGGEAVEHGDEQPDVGAEQGQEDPRLVQAEPQPVGLLAVTEEGVEEAGGEQGEGVGGQLEQGGGMVRPVPVVGLGTALHCTALHCTALVDLSTLDEGCYNQILQGR
jgi:hypothetical protein